MAQAPVRPYGAALANIIGRFGGRVIERESDVVVGITPGSVIGNDPDGLGLLLVNLSANIIAIGLRANLTLTQGILLGANGGSLSLDVNEDYTLPSREWFAIASGVGSALYVLRVSRDILAVE